MGPVFLPRSVLARTAAAAAFPCWFFRGFLFVFAFLCLHFCVGLSPLAFCGGPFGCVDGPHARGGDARIRSDAAQTIEVRLVPAFRAEVDPPEAAQGGTLRLTLAAGQEAGIRFTRPGV